MPIDIAKIVHHVRSDTYEDFVFDNLGHISEPDDDERFKDFYGPLFYKKSQRKHFYFVEGDKFLFQLIFNVIQKHMKNQHFWEVPEASPDRGGDKQINVPLTLDLGVEKKLLKDRLQNMLKKWGLSNTSLRIDILNINFDVKGVYADLECLECTSKKYPGGEKRYVRRIRKVMMAGKKYWNLYSIEKHIEDTHCFGEEDDNDDEEILQPEPLKDQRTPTEGT